MNRRWVSQGALPTRQVWVSLPAEPTTVGTSPREAPPVCRATAPSDRASVLQRSSRLLPPPPYSRRPGLRLSSCSPVARPLPSRPLPLKRCPPLPPSTLDAPSPCSDKFRLSPSGSPLASQPSCLRLLRRLRLRHPFALHVRAFTTVRCGYYALC